ncbi:LuxR family transcriptional regulator [Pseudoroseicyclus aestuarii]|uniref:LuxR family transcriptional regulator n=2 Tax=Pseudoroseicyclus aestuarii TaxID=1795041 RepID=A0A318TB07_9RHOB|nr:LuxR family transcriptional regulator [Pseudoroseicyclus aestuarii]
MALHVAFTTPAFMFRTYSREWTDAYTRRGLIMTDPTVRWGLRNTGMIRWSDLAPEDEAGILAIAAEYGLAHGVTYATQTGGSRSVCSFARSDRDFSQQDCDEIADLAETMHGLTANEETLHPEFRESLRQMAVTFSQP